ncbi:MAG: heparan-alpha-glucosaminide N-acetyltransferase [Chloroflexota bacterium]
MSRRWRALDAARGLSVVAMVAFHLIWDLAHFGYIAHSIPWSAPVKAFGHSIAFAFLFIAGVSLVLAHRERIDWRAFWRRFGVIAGAAALVSLGTWLVFPAAFVFFGILHCIAAASLLSLLFLRAPWPAALAAGAIFFAAPFALASPAFNAGWLQWLGLGTTEPLTQDWRPLFPWAGAMLLGVGAARMLTQRASDAAPDAPQIHAPGEKSLAFLGRHSLLIYLIHQPLLFGLFTLLLMVTPPPPDPAFIAGCEKSCREQGSPQSFCKNFCACTAEAAERDKTLRAATDKDGRMKRLQELADRCAAQ